MNLSDIFEYMSSEESNRLFIQLCSKTHQGGYLAYWNLFCDRHSPVTNTKAKLLANVSDELQKIDRVFFFQFYLLKVE